MKEERLPSFDPAMLLLDIIKLSYLYSGNRVNLRVPSRLSEQEGVVYGVESLYQRQGDDNVQVIDQSEYDTFLSTIAGSYLESVCAAVIDYIDYDYKLSVGRVRVVNMPAKYGLTYHTDPESQYRFHIPVVTNENVLFIVDDVVQRMPLRGSLYRLDVQKKHTVVNASREDRIHIIFDGYDPTTSVN